MVVVTRVPSFFECWEMACGFGLRMLGSILVRVLSLALPFGGGMLWRRSELATITWLITPRKCLDACRYHYQLSFSIPTPHVLCSHLSKSDSLL